MIERFERNPAAFLAGLVAAYVVVGVALHGLNGAEFIDSLRYMSLFHPPDFEIRSYGRYFHPPFYSVLLEGVNLLVGNPESAGKWVSTLLGALAILPIYGFAARCLGTRAGLLTAALYAVAALPWRWNIRVLSDGTFTCLFMASLWGLARGHLDGSAAHMAAGIFFGGLAAATRNQGFALGLPIAYLLLAQVRERGWGWGLRALAGAASWAALALTHVLRGWGWTSAFSGGGPPADLGGRLVWCALQLEFYLAAMPYIVGYPVALAAVYGLLCTRRDEPAERFFLQLGAYVWVVWFLVHAAVVGFTPRYFEPVLPLALAAAARGLLELPDRWRGPAVALTWAYSAFFAGAVLVAMHDELGDLARAGGWMRQQFPPGAAAAAGKQPRIVCAVEPPLALYYAGRWKGPGFTGPAEAGGLRPNDVVWIQTSMPRNGKYLNDILAAWEVETLCQEHAAWLPLMEDAYGPDSQTPAWFLLRYERRTSASLVLRILRRKP